MSFIRISLLLLICCTVALASCSSGEKNEAPVQHDSTALKVGIFPSLDAVPAMLAKDWGVYDSLGVSVDLIVYKSQLDAEEALAKGKVDAAMSDMFRIGWWQDQKKPVRFAFTTRRHMFVVPNKVLRVTQIDQLDDRMIAISRFSHDDYYCDKAVEVIKKRKGQILRPQINAVELRLSMLTSGQLDAAVLPAQQAYKSIKKGYLTLPLDIKNADGFAGYAYNTTSAKQKSEDLKKFESAYNIVVGQLHTHTSMPDMAEGSARRLSIDTCVMQQIKCAKDFVFTETPKPADLTTAITWLRSKSAVKASYSGDTLALH